MTFKELVHKASASYEPSTGLTAILQAVDNMTVEDSQDATELMSSFNFVLADFMQTALASIVFVAEVNSNCIIRFCIGWGLFYHAKDIFYNLDVMLNSRYVFSKRANTFEGVYAPFLEFLETT